MNKPDTQNKLFVDETTLIQDAYKLGVCIHKSLFQPDYIIGLWRGGSTIGIYVQECLQYLGSSADHMVIKTLYQGLPHYLTTFHSNKDIDVNSLESLSHHIKADSKILLVDDVFSTGRHLQAIIKHFENQVQATATPQIKIASIYYKPKQRLVDIEPDYFVHSTDQWVVLPYELCGLSSEELAIHKPWMNTLLRK